jgi:hypothetical protein
LHHLLYRRRGTGRKVRIPRVVSRDAVRTFSELRCGEDCLMSGGIDRTGAYGDGSVLECHETSRISAERRGHRSRKSYGLPALGRIARGAHCRLGRRLVNSLSESRGCACVAVRIARVGCRKIVASDRQRGRGECSVPAACPPLSVLVPRIAVPSLKITAPVGAPPLEVTVAVNTTFAPKADGFAE